MRLAENTRTAVKAAIRRAMRQARADLRGLDRDLQRQVAAAYDQALAAIRDDIASYADSNGSLRLQVLRQLEAQINNRLADLGQARDELLGAGLRQAADLGATPWATVGVNAAAVSDDAVRAVVTFTANDGLQLSDRLWRVDQGARESIQGAVQSAIVRGQSASAAVNEYLARGAAPPRDLIDKIGASSVGAVQQAAGNAWMTGTIDPRAQALRVFRTEINRAHGLAFEAAAFESDEVVGMKFLLSPTHPERDICDMHAAVNRYGLGPGVYPRGKSPWPAHPNTLSFQNPVFADEVTDDDRAGKQSRVEWLKDQPAPVRQAVLGGARKRWAFDNGHIGENAIGTPWRVVKKRLEREGITPPVFATNKGQTVVPPPQELTPAGAPVSAAVVANGQHQVVKRTLEVIDRVHRDGVLPTIPVDSTGAYHYLGEYEFFPYNNSASRIALSKWGDHKEHTLAHEIGHFLDHQGLAPGKGFASNNPADKRLEPWRKAMRASESVRALRKLQTGPATVDGIPVQKNYLDYLLDTREIWARSYAQWITQRSGDQVLADQLGDILDRQRAAKLAYPSQWEPEDFEPIARAIDDLFRDIGWLIDG